MVLPMHDGTAVDPALAVLSGLSLQAWIYRADYLQEVIDTQNEELGFLRRDVVKRQRRLGEVLTRCAAAERRVVRQRYNIRMTIHPQSAGAYMLLQRGVARLFKGFWKCVQNIFRF